VLPLLTAFASLPGPINGAWLSERESDDVDAAYSAARACGFGATGGSTASLCTALHTQAIVSEDEDACGASGRGR
jgi:hypothetical protein